jgi:hypothetical protein
MQSPYKRIFPAILPLLPLLFGAWASADVPKKAPITKYSNLWQNSPFTSKPPPPTATEQANPLEDYALCGISPIGGGYQITLLNKKKPEERITVRSDETKPKHGFKILEVKRKSGDPLGTTVRLSSGSVTGTVAFEEKLLALAAPPATKPHAAAGTQGAAPMQNPTIQPGQLPGRQPRPRVVPPPATNAAGGAGAPTFQPGGQGQGGGHQGRDHRGR